MWSREWLLQQNIPARFRISSGKNPILLYSCSKCWRLMVLPLVIRSIKTDTYLTCFIFLFFLIQIGVREGVFWLRLSRRIILANRPYFKNSYACNMRSKPFYQIFVNILKSILALIFSILVISIAPIQFSFYGKQIVFFHERWRHP